jgi:IS5 family transposase
MVEGRRDICQGIQAEIQRRKGIFYQVNLGALYIQNRQGYSDRETVQQITENLYLQYLNWFSGFQEEAPFHHPMVIHLRKRLGANIINELNEWIFMEEKNADLIMKMMTKEPRLQASISETRPCEDEKN